MVKTPEPRGEVSDSRGLGDQAQRDTPRTSHEGWSPAPDRPDPVALLEEQDRARDADLVPVRHGRMMVSPFTFYRGAAKIMAEDLWHTPTAGLTVQLCGDAHLSNFGLFASPERALVFNINDFDETLPGPFEYDLKRLATSFTVAGRHNGFSAADTRAATLEAVTAYRKAMAGFARMRTLEVWYSHLSADTLTKALRSDKPGKSSAAAVKAQKTQAKRFKAIAKKARQRDSIQALSKLAEVVDGRYRIVSQPPFVVPLRDWAAIYPEFPTDTEGMLRSQLAAYAATLQPDRRHLLERFQVVDVARKVVGVGSVGTRAFIVLMQGKGEHDPLFLQLKEASVSVLESHLPESVYRQHGERVVHGQRLMQATSDIFLGWTAGVDVTRSYYWRQLRDMKGSADVESILPPGLVSYAGACGWTLARAHARSGDAVAIAQYLADDDQFDRAIADFAERYAVQNDEDFEAFTDAVRTGRIQAAPGQ